MLHKLLNTGLQKAYIYTDHHFRPQYYDQYKVCQVYELLNRSDRVR